MNARMWSAAGHCSVLVRTREPGWAAAAALHIKVRYAPPPTRGALPTKKSVKDKTIDYNHDNN